MKNMNHCVTIENMQPIISNNFELCLNRHNFFNGMTLATFYTVLKIAFLLVTRLFNLLFVRVLFFILLFFYQKKIVFMSLSFWTPTEYFFFCNHHDLHTIIVFITCACSNHFILNGSAKFYLFNV